MMLGHNNLKHESIIENRKHFELFFENSSCPIMCFDTNGKLLLANKEARKNLSLPNFNYMGKSIYDLFTEKIANFHMERFSKIMKSGKGKTFEDFFELTTGSKYFLSDVQPLRISSGSIIGVSCISTEITDSVLTKAELEETNTALKKLISQLEEEKENLRESIALNIEKNITPILENIKKSKKYCTDNINILEKNIHSLTSDFYKKVISFKFSLTPKETKIADFVKNGYPAKEIANILNLSISTVHTHKEKIRKKLGITNKPVNLKTFLQILEKK